MLLRLLLLRRREHGGALLLHGGGRCMGRGEAVSRVWAQESGKMHGKDCCVRRTCVRYEMRLMRN